jgi:hypothetical protein
LTRFADCYQMDTSYDPAKNKNARDMTNCLRFYSCDNTYNGFHQWCAAGTIFDPATDNCNTKADCPQCKCKPVQFCINDDDGGGGDGGVQVTPMYEGRSGSQQSGRLVSIRRKKSDACGAVAPNVRRPSIRTDLLVAQARTNKDEAGSPARDHRCVLQ